MLGYARGSLAIRLERDGVRDVERMPRRTVLIDSQRVRVGYGAQRDPVLSLVGSLTPPADHDDVGLYVPEIARIFRAYGIGDGAQRRGMDGAEPEQVQQHQAGVSPSARKTDAATQSRILCAFGGRGGIEQDESGSAAPAPPCAPQGVTVPPVRGIVGGGPDVRGRNGIHNEPGSEAASRPAQRTPAKRAGTKRSGQVDCTTHAGRGSFASRLRRRIQPWPAAVGRGRTAAGLGCCAVEIPTRACAPWAACMGTAMETSRFPAPAVPEVEWAFAMSLPSAAPAGSPLQ